MMGDDERICNCCGLPCDLTYEGESRGEHGLLDCRVDGGYSSTPGNGHGALDDTTSYRFNLCEFCLDWLFGHFQVPVQVSCYMGSGEPETWRPAAQRVAEDDWRRHKDWFWAEYERRKEARERRRETGGN